MTTTEELQAELELARDELAELRRRFRVLRDRPELKERAASMRQLYGELAICEARRDRLDQFAFGLADALSVCIDRLPKDDTGIRDVVETGVRALRPEVDEAAIDREVALRMKKSLTSDTLRVEIAETLDRHAEELKTRGAVLSATTRRDIAEYAVLALERHVARLESRCGTMQRTLAVIAAPAPPGDPVCDGCRHIAELGLQAASETP